ncbi:MAG: excinuclease ABC subunit UvrA, partial [Spirochaetales bacterium]|nr:excinuclease ABC subunit UvrA [Spirochaetales bacterium]
MDTIIIRGAREHNLKNINLDLPRNKLIVISGLSGSGKSSLAFDTIFAEGQRRYMESLSSYARQFLGRLEKPDVDYIEGLSPAISIEQKTTHRNPRSTVGTVTEIYDYLRLLFARIGIPHCPSCGREIREQSIDQIIDAVNALPNGTRIMILAPVLRGKKGEHQRILEDAKRAGFLRVRIDGQIFSLEEPIQLEKTKQHSIDILIDRIVLEEEARKRMIDSLETALDTSGGTVVIVTVGEDGKPRGEQFFSQKSSCPTCGISLPELQPRLFSFNSPFGACPACSGLGRTLEFDPDLIMPDRNLSFNEGGIVPFNPGANWHRSKFESLAKHFNFSLDTPLKDLPPDILNIILQGTDEKVDVSYVN